MYKTKANVWIRLWIYEGSATTSSSGIETSFPHASSTAHSTLRSLLQNIRPPLLFRCICVTLIEIFLHCRNLNLQRQLAPLIVTNRTPSVSITRLLRLSLRILQVLLFHQTPLLPAFHQHHLQCRYYTPLLLLRPLLLRNHRHTFVLQNRTRS